MHGTYLIEVGYKEGVADPLAHGLSQEIRHAGYASVKHATVSPLYRLIGNLTPADRTRIEQDLLCDPVVQEARDGAVTADDRFIAIDVWYKSGVTDVIGESVLKGLRDLNISGIGEVRTGTRYRISGLRDAAAANKLALSLWVNPLVHDSIIHAD